MKKKRQVGLTLKHDGLGWEAQVERFVSENVFYVPCSYKLNMREIICLGLNVVPPFCNV